MIRIGLFCAAGMSTSLLVSKMRRSAEERGLEISVQAYPEGELAKRIDELDVALLGPQVRYMLSKAKTICEPKGVPLEVIDTMNYGMMNGEKVLDRAIQLREEKC